MRQGLQPPHSSQAPLSPSHSGVPYEGWLASPRPPSPASSLFKSDRADIGPDTTAGSTRRARSQGQVDHEKTDSSDDDVHAKDRFQDSAVQLLSAHNYTAGSGTSRASTLLLQMVPYTPTNSRAAYFHQSKLLLPAAPSETARSGTDRKPAMDEATKSVRLLLDKWTVSGSAPVSDLLIESATKDTPEE